ncbi:TadE/TadG family type IV pilus assembly protein [Ferrovum myxofaciens]|uniref:Pilus assembly protein n=1 Tax=Ferrovum myxofaciens TaxID=416213 RepID=A0A9E6SXC4_9PROT|nr:TadE family protein [Ferrovum myxofaciens]QKE39279.1 MAG: pilus assembly protein [Ferrovum myxofaciens]QWY74538.1 MAG: pilus assembly protein [Ferrovum myxofaciens]QWY77289.1 MAG: pilus assembly protein [Ferrovum myxofaciens]
MSSERGVAAVEFALIFPLMLLLMFGIIEFGTLMYDQIMVTNAAREGARWGSVQSASLAHPISCGDPGINAIQGSSPCSGSGSGTACMVASNYAANTLISYQGGSNNSPTVTVNCMNNNGAAIEVTVQYTFQGLGLGSLSAVQGSNNLSSKAVMYYE